MCTGQSVRLKVFSSNCRMPVHVGQAGLVNAFMSAEVSLFLEWLLLTFRLRFGLGCCDTM